MDQQLWEAGELQLFEDIEKTKQAWFHHFEMLGKLTDQLTELNSQVKLLIEQKESYFQRPTPLADSSTDYQKLWEDAKNRESFLKQQIAGLREKLKLKTAATEQVIQKEQ